jgi:hypothetical protein
MQSPGIFIDLRIPQHRAYYFNQNHQNKHVVVDTQPKSFHECTIDQLRILSRQHVFGGFSFITYNKSSSSTAAGDGDDGGMFVATRHHLIDWNYIGIVLCTVMCHVSE